MLIEKVLDVMTPSLKTLAKKHGVDIKYLEKQLKVGTQVELEHTTDRKVAKEIALDHLNELPDYYERLKKVEKKS